MNLLLVAATPFEIALTIRFLEQAFQPVAEGAFQKDNLHIFPLVTGVGGMATAWHLGRVLTAHPVDWALNAGIAGAFEPALRLGDVVQVISEQFGDLGVEEASGRFTDLFQLGLTDPNMPPYINGKLYNPAAQHEFLPAARGLTVNRVHGQAASIEAIRKAFPDVQVESMEGGAFFYGCLMAGVPFTEIRGISNYVEPRNRANWQIEPAIRNLNEVIIEMIRSLQS